MNTADTGWESRFDDRFTEPDQINGYHLSAFANGENIKDFIQQERELVAKEERRKTVEFILDKIGHDDALHGYEWVFEAALEPLQEASHNSE